MDKTTLQDLARRGAAVKIAELKQELNTLGRLYPDVMTSCGLAIFATGPTLRSQIKRDVKRRKLSAAGRRAIVKAQKARWDKFRAAKR